MLKSTQQGKEGTEEAGVRHQRLPADTSMFQSNHGLVRMRVVYAPLSRPLHSEPAQAHVHFSCHPILQPLLLFSHSWLLPRHSIKIRVTFCPPLHFSSLSHPNDNRLKGGKKRTKGPSCLQTVQSRGVIAVAICQMVRKRK